MTVIACIINDVTIRTVGICLGDLKIKHKFLLNVLNSVSRKKLILLGL